MKEGSFLKVLISNKGAAYYCYLPAIFILFAGLVLSLTLFVVLRDLERSDTETAFELAASERVSALQKELDTKIVILKSMLGLHNVSETIVQQGVYEFTKPLVAHMKGVQSLGWLPRVRDSQRAEFEASMRKRGWVDFRITERGPQGTLVRAARRDEYFPAADAGREEVDDSSIGFDVASDPPRWEALQRARDTGEISATARVVLINDLEGESKGQFGFLLFLPIYRKSLPADTVEERRRNLQGTLVGVFRLPDLVEGALLQLQPKGIDLLISDQSAPEGKRFLYFHSSRTRMEPIEETGVYDSGDLQFVATFEVGDRRWAILATPAPSFLSLHTTGEPLYLFIVGLLFTCVVVFYTVGSAHRTQVVSKVNNELNQEIIERQQAETTLQKTRESLTEAQHIAHLGSWEWDLRSAKLWWSDEIYCLLGFMPQEIEPTYDHYLERVHPEDREDVKARIEEGLANRHSGPGVHRIVRPDGEVRFLQTYHRPYLDAAGNPLRIIGTSQDITELKQAKDKVLEYQERLKSLVSELNRTEEVERRLLASELHDEIAQTLAVCKMKLGQLRSDPSTSAHSADLEEISELIQQAVGNLCSLTQELSPTVLYELGFESALEWLAEDFQEKYGLVCHIEQDQKPESLNLDTSIVLYQSIRELLLNAVRHGQASQVNITLGSESSHIRICIEDDGVGFDTTTSAVLPSETGRFGLFNICERIEALCGTFRIQSEPTCGTQVTLTAPLKQEDA